MKGALLAFAATACGHLGFSISGADDDGDGGLTLPPTTYLKASNAKSNDHFGFAVAVSADAKTVVVGAPSESANTLLLNGAAYVFALGSAGWTEQALLRASNSETNDVFGVAVALSDDGNTLAISAPAEGSSAVDINGNQTDNSAQNSGAVYVFARSGGAGWSLQAYVKASNTGLGDRFGQVLALSGDGNTLAVGANLEDSDAVGVGGIQNSENAPDSGAVYVYTRSGATWSPQAYIKATNTQGLDEFGLRLALSQDGTTLAVGAPKEDSGAVGINGNQADNSVADAGAVYVYTIGGGGGWVSAGYIKASNPGPGDWFGGGDLRLSADGTTLVVGAKFEDSSATGIDGDQVNDAATSAGAVYVFTRAGATWTQQAYLKASNTGAQDQFGYSLALSLDGNTLAVGANAEDSAAVGIDGSEADGAVDSGAAYLFVRSGTTWAQQQYVKATNTDAGDSFGVGLAMNGDGRLLAVGAWSEASAATGINGDQTDNSAPQAGAGYLYAR